MLCFEINKVPGKPFCFVPLWGGRGTLEREQKVGEGRGAPQRTTAMEDEDCTGGSSLSSLPGMRVGEAGGREIPKEAV